jgi:Flp pilus assembly protein TadD
MSDLAEPRSRYLDGLLLLRSGDAAHAAELLTRAVATEPAHLRARVNLVRALLATGDMPRALHASTTALRLAPDHAELHFARGTALSALGDSRAASQVLRYAASLDPSHAPTQLNLGNAHVDLDDLPTAEFHIRAALQLVPSLVEAHASLGFVLTSRGCLGDAIAACETAIALQPNFVQAHWNLAVAALLTGDFQRGFAEYEWRKRHDGYRHDFIDLPGPVWNGNDPAGRTILVHAEQGLGDTIQFARYLPLIAARGGNPILACDPALLPLLATLPGVTATSKAAQLPPYDAWIDQMSLPRVFATRPDTIPSPGRYLSPDPARVAPWRARLGPSPRLGLVWAGNPAHSNDRRRSLPANAVDRLCATAGHRFVSLQVGPRAGECGLDDLSPFLTNYAETAALIWNLDLLLTVDTSVAHLAGALGVPCWVMLPFAPDWRWILGRDDTPWYASLRLFRQERAGDWDGVISRIIAALQNQNRSSP